jgi:hypothetical protein
VVLSLVGVLWGLMLTKTPFGVIMTGLGVISLAGVVVNNAIVLLDYVEQLKSTGIATLEALLEAGSARFRPVMLTAATTVLGLVPMALGISIDFRNMRVLEGTQSAQWWGAMAVAVIFGLAFATVLTLVLVPTMYSILEDFKRLFAKFGSSKGATASASMTVAASTAAAHAEAGGTVPAAHAEAARTEAPATKTVVPESSTKTESATKTAVPESSTKTESATKTVVPESSAKTKTVVPTENTAVAPAPEQPDPAE